MYVTPPLFFSYKFNVYYFQTGVKLHGELHKIALSVSIDVYLLVFPELVDVRQ